MLPLRSRIDSFLSLPSLVKEDIIFDFLSRFAVDFEKNQDILKSVLKLIEKSYAPESRRCGQETAMSLSKIWEVVVEDDRLTLRRQLDSVLESEVAVSKQINLTSGEIKVIYPSV